VYACPESYGYQNFSAPVSQETVDELRSQLPFSKEEAYRFVDEGFHNAAFNIYIQIGSPDMTAPVNGWNIFKAMSPLLENLYFASQ
jgi:hypothetical protein